MLVAALKTNGVCPIYAAMLDAAPVPPTVESLLENWTPSDQQAFAKFRDKHFPGEMSSHAIQSLGSAWKDGQANATPPAEKNICRDDGRCEYAIQSGVEGLIQCQAGKCAMPQPAAHLTIPGALEWDGDNGTHGADGESRAHGESLDRQVAERQEPAAAIEPIQHDGWAIDHSAGRPVLVYKKCSVIEDLDAYYILSLVEKDRKAAPLSAYTAVDMTTAAAGGFRDGQTAATDSLKAFANEMIGAAFEGGSFDGGDIQDIAVKHGLLQIEQRAEECGEVCACREYGFPAKCYRKTDLVLAAKGGCDE
jgi:hypothetical protein